MSILNKPYFHDEKEAFKKLEAVLWPNGPVCPHCGNKQKKIYSLEGVRSKPSKKNPEGLERYGLKKCGKCRKQFTVCVGTLFESSHIPLHKWFQAVFLMCSSKKGISAHQLHRVLEITYKSAWFMAHRIREAMRTGELGRTMGGGGGIAEADETYFGSKDVIKKRTKRGRACHSSQRSVVALVGRGGGVRSFYVERATQKSVTEIVSDNICKEAVLFTDESRMYDKANEHVSEHDTVKHTAGEYVRGDVHTNTVEGFFSIFKRGMKGVYQHCSEKHLHRYLAEFDFRYSNRNKLGVDDVMRTEKALKGIAGRQLTYTVSND